MHLLLLSPVGRWSLVKILFPVIVVPTHQRLHILLQDLLCIIAWSKSLTCWHDLQLPKPFIFRKSFLPVKVSRLAPFWPFTYTLFYFLKIFIISDTLYPSYILCVGKYMYMYLLLWLFGTYICICPYWILHASQY